MARRAHGEDAIGVTAALALVLAALTRTGPEAPRAGQAPAVATATPMPREHAQLRLPGEVILLTLGRHWPDKVPAADHAIRLVSRGTLDRFLGLDASGSDPSSPLWLLGVIAVDGLHMGDVIEKPITTFEDPSAYPMSPERVPGAYYVWDANKGDLILAGALYPGVNAFGAPSLEALKRLTSEAIPIVTPSPQPTYDPSPVLTPGSEQSFNVAPPFSHL